MQVYRGMDIGTAKATPMEQAAVPHHLLDLVDSWETFDVSRFQDAVRDALTDIAHRDQRAVLVGGTGLYLRAVVDDLEIPGRFPDVLAALTDDPDTEGLHRRLVELDPTAAERMEPTNRRRVLRALEVTLGSGRTFSSFGVGLTAHPPSPVAMVGLWQPRPVLAERIERRYRRQIEDGFLAEVERLAAGPPLSRTAAQALGYRELLAHLAGETSLEEALELAITRTRQFARRQRVWFRKDPRISWLGADDDPLVDLPLLEQAAAELWD